MIEEMIIICVGVIVLFGIFTATNPNLNMNSTYSNENNSADEQYIRTESSTELTCRYELPTNSISASVVFHRTTECRKIPKK